MSVFELRVEDFGSVTKSISGFAASTGALERNVAPQGVASGPWERIFGIWYFDVKLTY